MADLQIIGRHALLFDDDSSLSFVNSDAGLVAWAVDSSFLIDRYDARHLLDRVPLRPKPGYVHKSDEDLAEDLVLDRERYLDLPNDNDLPDETEVETQAHGTYGAVPFSYGSTGEDEKESFDSKMDVSSSVYRPPFPMPERLMNHLPPSEKVHQIISRTAKFVSEHGGQSEIVLRVKQGNNPTFGFLMPDHELYPYFQFLVQNPNLLKTDLVSNGGALSLLGSVYGSGEDDDDDDVITPPSNPNSNHKSIENEENNYNPKDVGTKYGDLQSKEKNHNPNGVGTNNGDLQSQEKNHSPNGVGAMNGDLHSEETMSKPVFTKKNPSIVKVKDPVKVVRMMEPDSVMRNAMEKIAEFILRNGRELETVLIEQDKSTIRFPFLVPTNTYHAYYLKVLEETKEGKRSEQRSSTDSRNKTGTRESTPSIEYRSRECTPSEEPQKREKFKMVLSKPSKTNPGPANQNLTPGLTTEEAAAIVQAATRGKSPSVWSQVKKNPGLTETRPVNSSSDDAWISETIAKTAALVSSNVNLSLSKESKEEKVKSERLKRAKMLSSMIKNSGGGPHLSELLNKVTEVESCGDGNKINGCNGNGEASKRDKVERRDEREKEKSEVMSRSDGSNRESKKYRKHDGSSDVEERKSSERKNRDKHSDEKRMRHRKHHSSDDEERERRERKRKRHSYQEEDRYRKRRHRKRDYSDYSSGSEEDRRRKISHRKSSCERRIEDEREESGSNLGEKREQSTDVPDELRAKIRAMLLQTL